MAPSTKLEDKLGGIQNSWAWKCRIGLILKENDLEKYIKDEIPEPKKTEAKEKHKKDLIRAQRIIIDSIKDHLSIKCHPRRLWKKCMMPYPECMKEETSTERWI